MNIIYIICGIIIYFLVGFNSQIFAKNDPSDTEFEIGLRVVFWPFCLLWFLIIGVIFIVVFCFAMIGRMVCIFKIKKQKSKLIESHTISDNETVDKYLNNEKVEF